ncbi:hypothetical protein D3C80_1005880 [compost metagenome]
MFRSPLLHAAREIAAECIVVADKTLFLAPVAGRNRDTIRCDDIDHRRLGRRDQLFKLAAEGNPGSWIVGRQRVDHIAVLRQEQGQRARPLEHGLQQRHFQARLRPALQRQAGKCRRTSINTRDVKNCGTGDECHQAENNPGAAHCRQALGCFTCRHRDN